MPQSLLSLPLPFPLPHLIFLFTLHLQDARACLIAGRNSGECRTYEENELYMPYCARWVKYEACVPLTVQTPGGEWDNHTLPAKDEWVEETSMIIIMERLRHEMNETLDDLEVNELGEEGYITRRFWNGNRDDSRGARYRAKEYGGSRITDCETAFQQFMCYMNFPRCDAEGRSLILCRSVCENYMQACGYDQDLWRCGDPKFLGDQNPEIPELDEDSGEYSITWRALFPGAPFRDNEFDWTDPENPIPVPVCTPSVLNDGHQHFMISSSSSVVLFLVLLLFQFY